jgi:hypothetical protein
VRSLAHRSTHIRACPDSCRWQPRADRRASIHASRNHILNRKIPAYMHTCRQINMHRHVRNLYTLHAVTNARTISRIHLHKGHDCALLPCRVYRIQRPLDGLICEHVATSAITFEHRMQSKSPIQTFDASLSHQLSQALKPSVCI